MKKDFEQKCTRKSVRNNPVLPYKLISVHVTCFSPYRPKFLEILFFCFYVYVSITTDPSEFFVSPFGCHINRLLQISQKSFYISFTLQKKKKNKEKLCFFCLCFKIMFIKYIYRFWSNFSTQTAHSFSYVQCTCQQHSKMVKNSFFKLILMYKVWIFVAERNGVEK